VGGGGGGGGWLCVVGGGGGVVWGGGGGVGWGGGGGGGFGGGGVGVCGGLFGVRSLGVGGEGQFLRPRKKLLTKGMEKLGARESDGGGERLMRKFGKNAAF